MTRNVQILLLCILTAFAISVLLYFVNNSSRLERRVIYYNKQEEKLIVKRHWLRRQSGVERNVCAAIEEQLLPIDQIDITQPIDMQLRLCILNKRNLYVDLVNMSEHDNQNFSPPQQAMILAEFIKINFRYIRNTSISVNGSPVLL